MQILFRDHAKSKLFSLLGTYCWLAKYVNYARFTKNKQLVSLFHMKVIQSRIRRENAVPHWYLGWQDWLLLYTDCTNTSFKNDWRMRVKKRHPFVVINLHHLIVNIIETNQQSRSRSMVLLSVKSVTVLIAALTFIPVVQGGGYYSSSYYGYGKNHYYHNEEGDTVGTFVRNWFH